MARNRSEILPRCPEAYAYADAVDLYFAGVTARDPLPPLWQRIAADVKDKLRHDAPTRWKGYTMSEYDDIWRKHVASKVRERYAP